MVMTDFLRAGIVALVPLIDQLWWIYAWAFLLESASIIFLTARDSSVPDLADKSRLPAANAMVLATSYGSIPIAAGMFAAIAAIPLSGIGWLDTHDLALVFWIDAVTFIYSAFFIARISGLRHSAPSTADRPQTQPESQTKAESKPLKKPEKDPSTRFLSGFKLPLIRQIMPAVAAVSIGLGALFSLGITLIREELNASDVEFGIMILIFGAGALVGLAATRKMGQNHLAVTRLGTLAMGAIVGVMSLSPYLWGTYLGAAGFGMGATIALTAGMSTLQANLLEKERILAFAIFHLVIRVGLGASAVITGLVGDVLGDIPVGWGNSLAGTRLVLLAAGVLIFFTAWLTQIGAKTSHKK